jgi:hypothetical protein
MFDNSSAAPTNGIRRVAARDPLSMRWGLIPSWWKKTVKEVPSTFNARAETVANKPMVRAALHRPPCVINTPSAPLSGISTSAVMRKVKKHLELLGAKVAGPATTTAEADGLLTEHLPDVAPSTSIFERANCPTA